MRLGVLLLGLPVCGGAAAWQSGATTEVAAYSKDPDDRPPPNNSIFSILETLKPRKYLLETSDSSHTESKRSYQVCLRVVSRRAL